ncbi:hypothetical protein E3O45_13610 [Cryobacterium sp. TMS1-20-1]|uniref:hypothetical protein n=1 Tax=Cryobacterium sp. TMS1-20-1 TaxID=1259223 RepID=UPI00106C45B4|nr:hypothetical protein [Cryobacterium sp. TMS1-20-1]TFC72040.1 hypothetical protein E3O45_13610 [Cryobacterium sp. TMS1-20-1]
MKQKLVSDVCKQIGLHPHACRSLFPTDDVLLDAVNDLLVEECAQRLRGGVSAFTPKGDGVILDTWERSFEAWLLSSYTESNFSESPYIARTLPALLEQVSERRS